MMIDFAIREALYGIVFLSFSIYCVNVSGVQSAD